MIPVNEPILGEKEKENLIKCIDDKWISSEGPYVKQFEKEFSEYIGCKYGVSVCNGTAAIETALYALGVKEGDEVIFPDFTIISCAIAVLRLGAIPVVVDSEPETWNINPDLIEKKITNKTKVIMAVHMYGHPADMNKINEIAKRHNLLVMEDAAEAHGVEYNNQKCGNLGDISSFSFYANKIITTGEGGMVVTNNPEYAKRAQSYRNLCFQQEKRFVHEEIGYNFRMSNLQAAVGVAQLNQIENFLKIKRRNGELYTELLKDIPEITLQKIKENCNVNYWMYGILLNEGFKMDAKELAIKLKENGIGSRPFFVGMHEQPCLLKRGLFENEEYPVSENLARRGLYLPSGLLLTSDQVHKVVETLKLIIKESK